MDFQGALRARLLAAAPVTALVAQRVYWVERPQASALPAVTLQTISDTRPQHMTNFDGLDVARVQVDVWGLSYSQVKAIAESVINAVVAQATSNGIRFDRAFIDSIRDLGERTETQFIHRTSIDMIFHHTVA